jgi:spermidine synthase
MMIDPHFLVFVVAHGIGQTFPPRRILVVGLGGGSLPMFLRKHYPAAEIDAVDIDPGVVEVAKKFFGFREDERMRAHVGDGRQFIENVRQPYDLIILDAFGARSVPAHLTTLEFLQAVRSALATGGVVVSNIWRPSHNAVYNEMIRTHQAAFDELFILEVPGDVNNILLALPRKQTVDRSELTRTARRISAERQFRFDLGDFVVYGFTVVTGRNYPGNVLRDADLKQSR